YEQRFSRPSNEARTQQFGPPAGYQPIVLPGESISKYKNQPAMMESQPLDSQAILHAEESHGDQEEHTGDHGPIIGATGFAEDEPVFASASVETEPLHEEHHDAQPVETHPVYEEQSEASTSVSWNREFRQPEREVEAFDESVRADETPASAEDHS